MKQETITKQNLKFKPNIYRNMNPAGNWCNVKFGLYQGLDTIVRVITLGRYATNLALEYSRIMTVRHFAKLKQQVRVNKA